jgi:hypothetical protein
VPFDDYLDWGASNPYEGNADPMTGLMSALSHSPQAALDFFSDNDDDGKPGGELSRAYYYIHERDWEQDSFDSISQVLDAATTDESLIHGSREQQERAALLASKTVDYLSTREDQKEIAEALHRWPENGASEDLAHILSTYMPSVEDGIGNTKQEGDGPDQGSFPIDSLGGRDTAPMPVFYEEGLKNFMLLSTATDQGLGELTAGINDWRGQNLGSLADAYQQAHDRADGSSRNSDVLSVTDAKEALENGIKADARLQGFLLGTMGTDEIHEAGEQDKRTRATIGLFSDLADAIPVPGAGRLAEGAAKELILAGVSHARGEGFEQLEEALAHAEKDAVTDWNDKADATLQRENYTIAALLDSRGLSNAPDQMDPIARPGGDILTYDEYLQLDSSDRRLVDEELFGTAHGVGTVMDRQDYAEAYRSEFGTYFQKGAKE